MSSRQKKLTDKAYELFEDKVREYLYKFNRQAALLDSVLVDSIPQGDNAEHLQDVRRDIERHYNLFKEVCSEFVTYLQRVGTEESIKMEVSCNNRADSMLNKVQVVLKEINDRRRSVPSDPGNLDAVSVDRNTTCTTSSSLLMRQRAKAEAARVRLKFAEKEAELLKKRADIESSIKLLTSQRELDEAEAELIVIEEVTCTDPITSTPRRNQATNTNEKQTYERPPKWNDTEQLHRTMSDPTVRIETGNQETEPLNASAPPFVPSTNTQTNICTELSNFLVKRDLHISRLHKFSDKPEHFSVWKSSFVNIMHDLNAAPREEIDLLLKWLGPKSSIQATNIYASHSHDPYHALRKIWQRLEERYACPELIESSLKNKLCNFPKISNRDPNMLYELADLAAEIESLKDNTRYSTLLAYYDSSAGVTPIVNKLPHSLQEKWTNEAASYKDRYCVPYPPFSVFTDFLNRQARIRNDPSFMYDQQPTTQTTRMKTSDGYRSSNLRFSSKKTEVNNDSTNTQAPRYCPFHNTAEGHTLNYCRGFRRLPLRERRDFLLKYKICTKCCMTDKHSSKECKVKFSCYFCGSETHSTAMHTSSDGDSKPDKSTPFPKKHGGESSSTGRSTAITTCTQVCEGSVSGKSCAKTLLVRVFRENHPEHSILTYAVLDDQSNRSLARSDFFDKFNEDGDPTEYSLSSCNGCVTMSGRQATGYVVQALDESATLNLPPLIECNMIPNMRNEIPTPEAARHHPHLREIADYITPIDQNADILLLIGRDLLSAHHVLDQRTGPQEAPFAQKLRLGWAIIGEVCLGKVHRPDTVTVNKVQVLGDGRPTVMEPCPNNFHVSHCSKPIDTDALFQRTNDDENVAMSVEDKDFIKLMNSQFVRSDDGYWTAPLPFRTNRPPLPFNRPQTVQRANLLHSGLMKDTTKRDHMVAFMSKIIERGHAEVAPPVDRGKECWYLPLFGVYSDKKPGQIRGVFDSSATFKGVSLNSVLMTGPDLTNSLLGVLLRFRMEAVAVTADIEQMFYCFRVQESHRDYLRFLWYRNNDPSQDIIEYRMTAHVFGNSPSPAIATYGLRRSVESANQTIKQLVEKDFYVDDALVSTPTEDDAINLIQSTQSALKVGGNIRLHKITSNRQAVLDSFDSDDLAKDMKDLDLNVDKPPPQRSLGLHWNIAEDTFTFQVSSERKLFTRRGVLSTINSLYDPLGIVAPVVVKGKLLLRGLLSTTTGWDEQLPVQYLPQWQKWCDSLKSLEKVMIPRPYSDSSFSASPNKTVHIFCDASKEAISAVAFIKIYSVSGPSNVSFVLGKTRVAPQHGHTIPRLELCAAVLSVDVADILVKQLHLHRDSFNFYSDSKVVLGYIHNGKRRFHVYVANRTDRIRRSSQPSQWHHVPTDVNPADEATRLSSTWHYQNSLWLTGPEFLRSDETVNTHDMFPLIDPDRDKELKPNVHSAKTAVSHSPQGTLFSDRFTRFSSWSRLTKTFSHLKHIARAYAKSSDSCDGWRLCKESGTTTALRNSEVFILKVVQNESYEKEITALQQGLPLPAKSSILPLSPTLDELGLLRVGGRLTHSKLSSLEAHPIIIPKKHHIALLLIRHFHQRVRHQGRHITEGAVRSAGFWIIGGKRLVSSTISQCVTCRRLRGKFETQKMSDLPADRLAPSPPFTYVGLDTFGPWEVITRRTRGGSVNNKRWAVLFTCLVIRAVHIELIEEMSSSSFINCLRRFIAIRGEVKQFRSDRGTNFIGAMDSLNITPIKAEDDQIHNFLTENAITWVLNTPHSSHMGGAWERMIGTARRILDAMLLKTGRLTHEVLSTLMSEVTAIINARPLTSISTDPEDPSILSPAMILTHKTKHSPSFNFEEYSSDVGPLCKAQWRQVQQLAEQFWHKWRVQYLHTLQSRTKWEVPTTSIKVGEVVLVKDNTCSRNEWPIGVVISVYPSEDGLVRKASVRIWKDGRCTSYIRPVVNLVRLL